MPSRIDPKWDRLGKNAKNGEKGRWRYVHVSNTKVLAMQKDSNEMELQYNYDVENIILLQLSCQGLALFIKHISM